MPATGSPIATQSGYLSAPGLSIAVTGTILYVIRIGRMWFGFELNAIVTRKLFAESSVG